LDVQSAEQPAVVRGVVIVSCGMSSSGIPPLWAATGRRPGVASVPDMSDRSADSIADQVMAVKSLDDIAVVSVHWGSNWGYAVDSAQIRFAHRLIDAGVDLVHGHSSHHPRPIEMYRGKLVLYGCGDTIDDYEGISTYESFRHELRLLHFASIDSSGTVLRMVPMRMRRMRLERAPEQDAAWLHASVAEMSRDFGTRVEAATDGVLTVAA
jgi:poly-gamma-glutamate capsule biosynthesis protein CapA/YwtB (metallophosphatase superfamily)